MRISRALSSAPGDHSLSGHAVRPKVIDFNPTADGNALRFTVREVQSEEGNLGPGGIARPGRGVEKVQSAETLANFDTAEALAIDITARLRTGSE